jgi:4-hydroxybenzoate polyprenyltransferase
MSLVERLVCYQRLMRLDKPIGTLLLLWPTLWAVWIAAEGRPRWTILWIFVAGTVLMRSAGCVINDYADRDFDPRVARTRDRPLAARQLGVREALLLATILSAAAFLLILQLNTLTIKLSFVALFIAASYPFTKRWFALPQAYLGVAFGFGIPMAFAAQTGGIPPVAWMLLAANVFWAIAYDTEYAMVDRDDDRKIGIRSSALLFGDFDVAAVMLCYTATLAVLAAVGMRQRFGPAYYAGLAAAGVFMAYHYKLIRGRRREDCFAAFLHNNWVGAAIFAGIVLDYTTRLAAE